MTYISVKLLFFKKVNEITNLWKPQAVVLLQEQGLSIFNSFLFIHLAKSCKQFDLRKFKEIPTMICFFGTFKSNEEDDLIWPKLLWGRRNGPLWSHSSSKENKEHQQAESKRTGKADRTLQADSRCTWGLHPKSLNESFNIKGCVPLHFLHSRPLQGNSSPWPE